MASRASPTPCTSKRASLFDLSSRARTIPGMRHFCTLFDRNYAARGLALHRSLMRHCDDFVLHILCLDAATREALAALSPARTELIDLEALERWDSGLREARGNRSALEFYFTCKPVLLDYLIQRHPQTGRVDYLDADLGFFADPALLDGEVAGSPVALSPHRFSERNMTRSQYGIFNAGWLSVGTDEEGRRFIAWWRALCLEWSGMVVEETRFGDQKYLDRVPALFPQAIALRHPGANLAPWNIDRCRVEMTPEGIAVDGKPLVFFHFHNVKRMLFGIYESGLHDYGATLTAAVRNGVYRPYLRDLLACKRHIAELPRHLRAPLQGENVALDAGALLKQVTRTARAIARRTTVFAAS